MMSFGRTDYVKTRSFQWHLMPIIWLGHIAQIFHHGTGRNPDKMPETWRAFVFDSSKYLGGRHGKILTKK